MANFKNIGGVWERATKAGQPKLSISVEIDGKKYNLTALKNTYKKDGDNQPDWTVMPLREFSPQSNQAPTQRQEESDIPF